MVKINKGDFVELDYTAKIKNTDMVFDTTLESDAKKFNIHNPKIKYKSLIVKLGEGQLVKGLDKFLEGKDLGEFSVDLDAEDAFGKKNPKLLRLVSLGEFRKNNIQAIPGLEVELDGYRGIVRTVNGGRVIIDFNHPLSSQDIHYKVHVKGLVTDPKTKVEATLSVLQLPFEKVEMQDGKAVVNFKSKIPDEVGKPIIEELKRLTELKDIEFK